MRSVSVKAAVMLLFVVLLVLGIFWWGNPTVDVLAPREVPAEVDVPILLYHHISDILRGCTTKDKFVSDMEELKAAGYNPVFYDDLYDYVVHGKQLPPNPIVLSFDDGYLSNYEFVYPLLKEYDFKAEIAFIGVLEGRTLGPDWWSEKSIYFTWSQAREMQDSGSVRIQSHTYNLHGYYGKYTDKKRTMESAVCPKEFDEKTYRERFIKDVTRMDKLIEEHLDYDCKTFVYPLGIYDETTEAILSELGYHVTLTVEPGVNRVVRDDPDTLRAMKRIGCDGYGGSVVELIEYWKSADEEL